jgi:hypothetical protein
MAYIEHNRYSSHQINREFILQNISLYFNDSLVINGINEGSPDPFATGV